MAIYSQQHSTNTGTTGNVTVAVGDNDTGGGLPEKVNVLVSIANSSFTFQPGSSSSSPHYNHVAGPGNQVQWVEISTVVGQAVFVNIVYAFAVPTGASSTHATVQVFNSRNNQPVTAPQTVPIIIQSGGTLAPVAVFLEEEWKRRFEAIEWRLGEIVKRLPKCD